MARKAKAKPEPEVEGLVFHEPKKLQLADINVATYNPRHIDDDELASLKASMVEHGVVLHFVVQLKADDGEPMVMIGGHQRLRAAKELCAEKGWPLPDHGWGVVLDVPDPKAKRLNVALNKISGDFDAFMLGKLFSDISPDMSFDEAIATGFQPGEIDELVRQALDPDAQADAIEQSIGDLEGFARSVTLTIVFDTVERRDACKSRLAEMAKKRGVKPGVLVEEAVAQLVANGGRPMRRRRKRKAAS